MNIKNNTKIEKVIERCKESAPNNSCSECACDERECLLYLLEAYNSLEIDYEIKYTEE